MPRNISFALTKQQFRARIKDVTRRLGWLDLKPGDILMGVEKAQGIKAGEMVRMGRIRVKAVHREYLDRLTSDPEYGAKEVVREGFAGMKPDQFVTMFCRSHKGCQPDSFVTRIEYEYL